MEAIRQKIFDWHLRHQAAREVVMYPWLDIRSVLILHEGLEKEHIAQQLRSMGKEVQVCAMPDKKEISWLTGMPKKEVREHLQSRHYDMLIDLTQQTNITMQYMALYTRTGIKTGRDIGKKLYDLSIDTPAQPTANFLFEQIVKYIQMFTQG
jgi:hypothetical protein